jgi:hypothetical protein
LLLSYFFLLKPILNDGCHHLIAMHLRPSVLEVMVGMVEMVVTNVTTVATKVMGVTGVTKVMVVMEVTKDMVVMVVTMVMVVMMVTMVTARGTASPPCDVLLVKSVREKIPGSLIFRSPKLRSYD